MAVDQDLLDQIAGSVADLYREVESSLVKVIADELRKDLPAPTAEVKLDAVRRLRAAAEGVQQRLAKTKSAKIREAVRAAYRSGWSSALTSIPTDLLVKVGAKEALDEVPNVAVIENIANALYRDLGRVEGNILRAPEDAYRRVQAATAARIAAGTATRRQASQAAWSRLMEQGITTFTDSRGRRWRLSSYAEMIGRTNVARAAVQGQMDRLESAGIDLVYISDNVQECWVCRPFESKVLRRDSGPVGRVQVEHATRDGVMVTVDVVDTLNGARSKGLFHPNCRHSASAYLPGITKLKTSTADPEGDLARQQQRALERRIRAAKEQALGALTPEAKQAAEADVRAAQAELRDHLAANPKLKRLRYREQIGAGNTPGPGGPKGGPVSDQPTAPSAPAAGAKPKKPPAKQAEDPAAKAAEEQAKAEQAAKKAAAEQAEADQLAAAKKAEQEAKEAAEQAEAERLAAQKEAAKKALAKARAIARAEKAVAKKAEEERRRREEEQRQRADSRARGMREGLRHRSNREGVEWARAALPMPSLTAEERSALRSYTGNAYEMVNDGLRGNLPTTARDKKNYDRIITNSDAAFDKSKLTEGLTLHRGVGRGFAGFLGADVTRPETMTGLIGRDFQEKGYMSTSVGQAAAFTGDIYLMIRAPAGTKAMNVMPVSIFGESEREVLLDRGMRYVVHACYQRGDPKKWFMEVEIVPEDWDRPADWVPDPYGDADAGYSSGVPKEA